jgi:hypothetical protein
LAHLEEAKLGQSDIDKYKLLVNESDMIIGLLLKQTSKLAYINNLISLSKFNEAVSSVPASSSYLNFYATSTNSLSTLDSVSTLSLTKSQVEIYSQELSQIQRKIDETLFLKQGVDKRAVFVREFLKK